MKILRVAVFAGFIIFLATCLFLAPSNGERIAKELMEQGALTSDYDQQAKDVLLLLTKGTKFEDRWQINGPPRKDSLNVYMLKPKKGPTQNFPDLAALSHNGAYLGPPNIVVIDANLLNEIPDQFDLYRYVRRLPNAESDEAEIRKAILTWILGHELGHILCGHGPMHFASNRITQDSQKASLGYMRELEADSRFANILKSHPDERLQVERTLIDLLNFEIQAKLGIVPSGVMILYDYKDQRVIHYTEMESHPEFVLRATRLLLITSKEPGSEALREETERFAKLLQPAN